MKMENYTLSDQAVGALMMALQKSLIEQSDIVPVIKGFQVQIDDAGQLVVVNPPAVEMKAQQPQTIETSVQ
jgi:hypothetical protein